MKARLLVLVVCLGAFSVSHAAAAPEKAAPPGPKVATQGGELQVALPLFPANNWWNLDISSWPVDAGSTGFINFIGVNRGLHPDFGGDSTPAPEIYGFPYVVVDADQPKKAVQFLYSDESDGVDHGTNQSFPFYPIPDEAITQPHWIEGGYPGNQACGTSDRHMLIVDRDSNTLYELYDLCWDGTKWTGGSGAFFDMKTNNRRPEGWTSADAAGLAILPGLVRYDEVFGPDEIDHAFRVTVRATNGHVYPASHTAGSTSGALPMGARLRLKTSKDISGFPQEIQRIFRAMKKYGLIVADNGSDMYISGTYDIRWDNGVLNPAFSSLTANDFEVVQLGYNPAPAAPQVGSVTPSSGTTAGGTAVVIAGGSFVAGATVNLGGGAATNVAIARSTRIVATTPAHAAGPVSVVVTNPDSQTGTGGFTYCAGAPAAPAITAAASAPIGATGLTASVPSTGGSTYTWTLTGGRITAGQGTSQVTFDAGPPGTTMVLRVSETPSGGCSSAARLARVQVHFLDAPPAHPFHTFINTIARNGITGGCGGGNYCPDGPTTRAQMAVFLLRGEHGGAYVPPAANCAAYPFSDVVCPSAFADFILQLVVEGITSGCGSGTYCPGATVTRRQMAVFLLKAEHGSGYTPPAATGIFQDVPQSDPFAAWIERLYNEGITGGCSTTPLQYCPASPVTRGQMAVFLVRTFSLT